MSFKAESVKKKAKSFFDSSNKDQGTCHLDVTEYKNGKLIPGPFNAPQDSYYHTY